MAKPKMVHLKRTPADKKAEEKRMTSPASSTEDYPYDTRMTLDHEMLKHLGMHEGPMPKTGTPFKMMVHGHISRTEANERDSKARRSMTLQFTHLPHKLGMASEDEEADSKPGAGVRADLEKAMEERKAD